MKRVADFVLTNWVVLLLMFVISLLGNAVTIFTGWKAFYNDYLSKTISMPTWLIVVVLVVLPFAIAVFMARRRPDSLSTAPKERITNQTFGMDAVVIDGKHFTGCTFNGTDLILEGIAPFGFEYCTFNDPRFRVTKHAELTLGALIAMYKNEPFRPFVEGTFNIIRQGGSFPRGPGA
jgi:hypothetical protein